MQGHILVFLFLAVTLTEGLFFDTNKCPIKQYKSSKYITGYKLLVHDDFTDRVKGIETAAKECKVHVYITGSYYQLSNPASQVLVSEADLVIGHAFQFELRDLNDAILCNKLCLSKNPMDLPEVKCLIQRAQQRGLKWTIYNSNVLTDGTYASNTQGYQALKVDIQTKCADKNLKREFLRTLRRMYEDEQSDEEESVEDEKKK